MSTAAEEIVAISSAASSSCVTPTTFQFGHVACILHRHDFHTDEATYHHDNAAGDNDEANPHHLAFRRFVFGSDVSERSVAKTDSGRTPQSNAPRQSVKKKVKKHQHLTCAVILQRNVIESNAHDVTFSSNNGSEPYCPAFTTLYGSNTDIDCLLAEYLARAYYFALYQHSTSSSSLSSTSFFNHVAVPAVQMRVTALLLWHSILAKIAILNPTQQQEKKTSRLIHFVRFVSVSTASCDSETRGTTDADATAVPSHPQPPVGALIMTLTEPTHRDRKSANHHCDEVDSANDSQRHTLESCCQVPVYVRGYNYYGAFRQNYLQAPHQTALDSAERVDPEDMTHFAVNPIYRDVFLLPIPAQRNTAAKEYSYKAGMQQDELYIDQRVEQVHVDVVGHLRHGVLARHYACAHSTHTHTPTDDNTTNESCGIPPVLHWPFIATMRIQEASQSMSDGKVDSDHDRSAATTVTLTKANAALPLTKNQTEIHVSCTTQYTAVALSPDVWLVAEEQVDEHDSVGAKCQFLSISDASACNANNAVPVEDLLCQLVGLTPASLSDHATHQHGQPETNELRQRGGHPMAVSTLAALHRAATLLHNAAIVIFLHHNKTLDSAQQ